MKLRRLPLASLIAIVAFAVTAPALKGAEQYLEFVEGLREREYFDYAVLYLEQLDTRPNVPPEIKEVIPYEKAITLLQGVKAIKNPDLQTKQLDLAKGFLEEFLKTRPDHPKAAQASTELAQVLIGKGRVEVIQSRNPNNAAQKADFQGRARTYVAEARKVFEAAHDKYMTAYKKFPTYIDKTKEKKQFDAREKALVNYIQAQLNLAIVTYEEAQCYDRTDPEFKKLLIRAATGPGTKAPPAANEPEKKKDDADEKKEVSFENIHSKYRSQVAGLYARMWEGKCFEEQDDITKALGIYNELLEHPGESPAMKTLQDRVQYFRLICLNHDQRKDYQVVYNEGNEWIKKSPAQKKRSRMGVGIQWEMARACEGLATKPDTPAVEKDRWATLGLKLSRDVNAFPGEYKEVSSAMIQRLSIILKRDPSDPKDFDTAYGLARNLVNQISKMNDAIKAAANPADRKKLEEGLAAHLKETSRILRLALTLFTPKDEIADVNRARYYLAYVYYLQKDMNYESAILAEFVATRYTATQPELALDSAYVAMASYVQAHGAAKENERESEIQRIISICNFITTKWPTNDKANDARMRLGTLYSQNKKPAEAAKIFGEIPDTAPQFLEAQLAAGQAYWQAYLEAAVLPDDKRPPKEQLDALQSKAKEILNAAIVKLESKLPKDAPPPDNVTLAKFSLSQILNGSGDYKGALLLLTDGTRSVVAAIAVAKEADRPKRGVKSPPFASAAFREVLRAYVGTQQLDQARSAMKELEKIEGGAGGGIDVTRIYLQLGKELEKEVKRLQAAKDTRLAEVLKSFETFLDDMFKRAVGQDYNSLQWVAQTYYALGEGLEEGDKARSASYFDKASLALQAILEQAGKDSKFVPDGQLTGVQLRLVNCKRRQQAFEEALKLVVEIVKAKPKALDAQVEAARLYQDWAARGGPDDWKKWKLAIHGDAPPKNKKEGSKTVWGWFDIGERLARNLEQGTTPNPDFEKQYLEARYNVAYCRFKFALAQPAPSKKKQFLEDAQRDVTLTTSLSEDLGGGESWEKFNRLYHDIQQEAGTVPVVDLEKRIKKEPKKIVENDGKATKRKKKKPKVAAAPVAKPPPPSGGGWMLPVGIVVLLVVGGGGAVLMFGKGKKKKEVEVSQAPSTPPKKKPAKAKA